MEYIYKYIKTNNFVLYTVLVKLKYSIAAVAI